MASTVNMKFSSFIFPTLHLYRHCRAGPRTWTRTPASWVPSPQHLRVVQSRPPCMPVQWCAMPWLATDKLESQSKQMYPSVFSTCLSGMYTKTNDLDICIWATNFAYNIHANTQPTGYTRNFVAELTPLRIYNPHNSAITFKLSGVDYKTKKPVSAQFKIQANSYWDFFPSSQFTYLGVSYQTIGTLGQLAGGLAFSVKDTNGQGTTAGFGPVPYIANSWGLDVYVCQS